MSVKKKVYFPGLNGLRFLAAFAVILTHIELIKAVFGYDNMWSHPVFFNLGGLGVVFFFVLSGFLITYLLLTEKQLTKNVCIKSFYLRRIFRIWPLYYFVLIVGFFVLPFFNDIDIPYLKHHFENNFWGNLTMYIFILPNLAYAAYNAVPHIGQSWSIGVEEQFYLIWPLLLKFSKRPLRLIVGMIGFLILVKAMVLFFAVENPGNTYLQITKRFLAMSKIESMCIGAIGAYLLFHKKEKLLKWLNNSISHLLSWLLIPVLIFYTPDMVQDGIHMVYSVLFLIIILNISSNNKSFLKLENPTMNFLGTISYGLYMYHLMLIPIILVLLKTFGGEMNGTVFNIVIYTLVIGLTILVAYLSNRYLETPFLQMKRKYSSVVQK